MITKKQILIALVIGFATQGANGADRLAMVAKRTGLTTAAARNALSRAGLRVDGRRNLDANAISIIKNAGSRAVRADLRRVPVSDYPVVMTTRHGVKHFGGTPVSRTVAPAKVANTGRSQFGDLIAEAQEVAAPYVSKAKYSLATGKGHVTDLLLEAQEAATPYALTAKNRALEFVEPVASYVTTGSPTGLVEAAVPYAVAGRARAASLIGEAQEAAAPYINTGKTYATNAWTAGQEGFTAGSKKVSEQSGAVAAILRDASDKEAAGVGLGLGLAGVTTAYVTRKIKENRTKKAEQATAKEDRLLAKEAVVEDAKFTATQADLDKATALVKQLEEKETEARLLAEQNQLLADIEEDAYNNSWSKWASDVKNVASAAYSLEIPVYNTEQSLSASNLVSNSVAAAKDVGSAVGYVAGSIASKAASLKDQATKDWTFGWGTTASNWWNGTSA